MKRLTLFVLVLAMGREVQAQSDGPDILWPNAYARPDTVIAGGYFTIGVTLQIEDGWHINSDQPLDAYLIPTEVSWDLPEGFEIGEIVYPKDKRLAFAFSDKKLSVFDRKVDVSATVQIPPSTPGGVLQLNGRVRYQACNDEVCLPPNSVAVEAAVYIKPNP